MTMNKGFFDAIKSNTNINSEFEAFKDTAWFERYLLNAYQFSSAKDMTETKALQSLAVEVSGFKDFKEKASEIVDINRDQWLRVEQDSAIRGSVMGEAWRNIEQAKEFYPYWVYKTEEDERVRDEHAALDNLIFRIGDPDGDACYPPNDWNCRCHAESVDSADEIAEGKDYLNKDDPETGKPYIGENFKFNPGINGPMPNDSDYFDIMKNINNLSPDDFE